MNAGTELCFLIVLIGLSLHSEMSYKWWVAGMLTGFLFNFSLHVIEVITNRRKKELDKEVKMLAEAMRKR